MTRLPLLRADQLIKILQGLGFQLVRQRGSHVRLRHPAGRVVTVPAHSGQVVGRGLLRKIMRDAEISPDELDALR